MLNPSTPVPGQPTESTALLERIERDIERPISYVARAVQAAWWPIEGIWFFTTRREYWPLFSSRLVPLAIISLLTYIFLFSTIFIPQYLFLAIWQGWGAWFNAAVLVLGEGNVIIQGLFEGFFMDRYRVDVFDATLIDMGFKHLVAAHRELNPDAPTAVMMLGKPKGTAQYQPFSLKQLIELIFYLPLNFIPVFGPIAYIMITGLRLGKLSLYRWYKLRDVSHHDMKRDLRARSWDYLWYGTVCQLFEMIPVLSFFLLMPATVGSALWAAHMEKEMQEGQRQQQANGIRTRRATSMSDEEECLHNDPV